MSATPSAQYRLTIRVKLDDAQGILGHVTTAIGEAGGIVGAVDLVEVDAAHSLRDIVVDASGREHWDEIIAAIDAVAGAEVIDTTDRTFLLHVGGKIEQHNKHPLKTRDDLSMAYTPGVARVCLAIADDPDKAFQYTIKRNTVAVVSDGTAVLGLGDIGPAAAMPVMEGKCCLFKEFAGVDAFPICLDTTDTEEIVRDRRADRAGVRRHQPRGHLRAALLRDRGAAEGRARHPRLPRRPARHRGRRDGRAAQRRQAHRPAAGRPQRARHRPRRGRHRGHEDPARGRRRQDHRRGLARRAAHAARGLPRRLDEPGQALVRRVDQPGMPRRRAGRRDRRHGPADRRVRRARAAGARRWRA